MELGGDPKTREDIDKHGCTVMHVMEEDELPPFAYSIGVTQQTGAPEVIVIGLKQAIAHFVVNEYNLRVRSGERFERGSTYSGFLEGFDILFEDVPVGQYEEYLGQAISFYGGVIFKVLQIVYPSTQGIWPWATEAPESFKAKQPILGSVGAHGAL